MLKKINMSLKKEESILNLQEYSTESLKDSLFSIYFRAELLNVNSLIYVYDPQRKAREYTIKAVVNEILRRGKSLNFKMCNSLCLFPTSFQKSD